jgi:hypothetical protein
VLERAGRELLQTIAELGSSAQVPLQVFVRDEVQQAENSAGFCFLPDLLVLGLGVVPVVSELVEHQAFDHGFAMRITAQDRERRHVDPGVVEPGVSELAPVGHVDAQATPGEHGCDERSPGEHLGDATELLVATFEAHEAARSAAGHLGVGGGDDQALVALGARRARCPGLIEESHQSHLEPAPRTARRIAVVAWDSSSSESDFAELARVECVLEQERQAHARRRPSESPCDIRRRNGALAPVAKNARK